jgi:hypothetical protein
MPYAPKSEQQKKREKFFVFHLYRAFTTLPCAGKTNQFVTVAHVCNPEEEIIFTWEADREISK